MAYMSQEKKRAIAAALKKVVPKDWKYSLAVRNHSTLVMTISSAPVNLIPTYFVDPEGLEKVPRTEAHVNLHWLETVYADSPEVLEQMQQIKAVLNDGNWNKSDLQADYHNVGWYVYLYVGRWNKPFKVTG